MISDTIPSSPVMFAGMMKDGESNLANSRLRTKSQEIYGGNRDMDICISDKWPT